MSLATSNRDGGRTSESGHLRAIMKAINGEVLQGLAVSQRGAGANMSVDIAIGDVVIPRSDGTYGHPSWNDAVYNQAISTADVSNPRRDIIVMYIDYATTPSTGVSNNTNGVVKIKVVNGTPAGSPADPSDVAIQASVGSGNPFSKLARVRVAAGASSITNSVIDDLRNMATGLDNQGWVTVPNSQSISWAYSSYSSTTRKGVVTVPTDATTRYAIGTKVKFYQATGGWKYARVVGVTATSLTMLMLNSLVLNNEAIYAPSFSYAETPFAPTPIDWREQEPWQDMSLAASWVNYAGGYETAQYMKDYMGFVHIKGFIKNGTATPATVFCTLPAGYRPNGFSYYPVILHTGAAGSMEIRNTGTMGVVNMSATYTSFGQLSYRGEN